MCSVLLVTQKSWKGGGKERDGELCASKQLRRNPAVAAEIAGENETEETMLVSCRVSCCVQHARSDGHGVLCAVGRLSPKQGRITRSISARLCSASLCYGGMYRPSSGVQYAVHPDTGPRDRNKCVEIHYSRKNRGCTCAS